MSKLKEILKQKVELYDYLANAEEECLDDFQQIIDTDFPRLNIIIKPNLIGFYMQAQSIGPVDSLYFPRFEIRDTLNELFREKYPEYLV